MGKLFQWENQPPYSYTNVSGDTLVENGVGKLLQRETFSEATPSNSRQTTWNYSGKILAVRNSSRTACTPVIRDNLLEIRVGKVLPLEKGYQGVF